MFLKQITYLEEVILEIRNKYVLVFFVCNGKIRLKFCEIKFQSLWCNSYIEQT